MPEGSKVGNPAPAASFSILTAMRPRQVMLSASSKAPAVDRKPAAPPTAEQRKLLLQAVCQFLELNGFSKTLKKFLSEANIEKDYWKNSLFNLEDICFQYFAICASSDGNDQIIRGQDKQRCEITEKDAGNSIASGGKEKKEKKKESNQHNENDIASCKHSEIVKKCDKEETRNNVNGDVNLKSKEKKKKKSSNDSSVQMVEKTLSERISHQEKLSKKSGNEKKKSKLVPEQNQAESSKGAEEGKNLSDVERTSKSKSVKKKKLSSPAEIVEDKSSKNEQGETARDSGHVDQEKHDKESCVGDPENDIEKEKKSSKKRKRYSSVENQGNDAEDSKCNAGSLIELKAPGREMEDNHVDSQAPLTLKNSNGVMGQSGGDKSTTQKKSKMQKNEALNAFQRVKADEVVFVDERLQDNSYWAKDGADIGYGAKAQEILGQVRGRDFRHEKTKKKRGSYRGGQIDLHSHSIKFDYSDDDE